MMRAESLKISSTVCTTLSGGRPPSFLDKSCLLYTSIHVKEGESLDSALKRFKRSCAKAGIVAEVRKRECYESPSVKPPSA